MTHFYYFQSVIYKYKKREPSKKNKFRNESLYLTICNRPSSYCRPFAKYFSAKIEYGRNFMLSCQLYNLIYLTSLLSKKLSSPENFRVLESNWYTKVHTALCCCNCGFQINILHFLLNWFSRSYQGILQFHFTLRENQCIVIIQCTQ